MAGRSLSNAATGRCPIRHLRGVSHLGMSLEEILAGYPGSGDLLIQFVLETPNLRADAMASFIR